MAIGQMGHSPTLLSRLAEIERELALIDQQIAAQKPPDISVSIGDIRKFVASNITDIRSLLLEVPGKAKQKLMQQVGALTLMPQDTASGPGFAVTGNWNLLPEECVIQLVARDGIEPPTPAFSGLRSTD